MARSFYGNTIENLIQISENTVNPLKEVIAILDDIVLNYRLSYAKMYNVINKSETVYYAYGSKSDSLNYKDEIHYEKEIKKGVFGVEFICDPERIRWTTEEKDELTKIVKLLYIIGDRALIHSYSQFVTTHDTTTRFPNHVAYRKNMSKKIADNTCSDYTVCFMNIKKFRSFNRKYGFTAGNQAIQQFGNQCLSMLGPKEMFGRLGGDHFYAVVEKKHMPAFLALIENLQVNVEGVHGRQEVPLFVATGCYEITRRDRLPDEPLDCAALALSTIKGTDTKYTYLNDNLRERIRFDKEIVVSAEPSLESGDFEIYLQPKVSFKTKHLSGAEALVRWNHKGKVLSPDYFMPIFEKNGFVKKIDYYVLENVCKKIKEWIAHGISPVTVSVNFSGVHFTNTDVINKIIGIIASHDIPFEYIEIEVTETAYIENTKIVTQVLKELRNQGVKVAMDDFGSGYSSLNLLRDVYVDVIKLDRNFLNCDNPSEREKIVVKSIVNMANELGIDVIVEGVESLKQAGFLNDINCQDAQGYYFDRPMPIDQFEKKLLNSSYAKRFEIE